MFRIILFFTLLLVVPADTNLKTRFKDCGSTAKSISVAVEPCTDTPPCVFPRGKTATIEVNFEPIDAISNVSAKVYGYIDGIKVPFPLPDCTDPCNKENCKLKCPLVPETQSTYNVSIPVSSLYPKLKLIAELDLISDKGEKIVCIMISAEIV